MNKKTKFDGLHPVHKKFYTWIEEKGLMRRFSANIEEPRLATWKLLDHLDDFTIHHKDDNSDFWLKNTIGGAFVWGKTPQGHSFWNNVDAEWTEYYETLKS